MPSFWHPEALQAQAIAGRTYGVRQALKYGSQATFSSTRKGQCWCHLYDTTADQAYVGWLKENEPDDIPWKAAVDATAGLLVTHPQAPESTVTIAYYSSSSGGHTNSNVDGFGHSTLLPYLPGTDDPLVGFPAGREPSRFVVEAGHRVSGRRSRWSRHRHWHSGHRPTRVGERGPGRDLGNLWGCRHHARSERPILQEGDWAALHILLGDRARRFGGAARHIRVV